MLRGGGPADGTRRGVRARLRGGGIVVDCSHVNEETAMRIMALARKPVVFSHSNARVLNGTCATSPTT